MKREYPISFTAEMVKAILEGRKTQTRRLVDTKYLNAEPNRSGKFAAQRTPLHGLKVSPDLNMRSMLERRKESKSVITLNELKRAVDVLMAEGYGDFPVDLNELKRAVDVLMAERYFVESE